MQRVVIAPKTVAETDFTLQLTDDPEVNPVVLYALAQKHGLDRPESLAGDGVIDAADLTRRSSCFRYWTSN
jgi:hypothetical protein